MTLITLASRSLASVQVGPAVAGFLRTLFVMRTRSPRLRRFVNGARSVAQLSFKLGVTAIFSRFVRSSSTMISFSLTFYAHSSSMNSSKLLSSINLVLGKQCVSKTIVLFAKVEKIVPPFSK